MSSSVQISINQLMAKNALASVYNMLVAAKLVDNQLDSQFAAVGNGGYKPGASFKINRPARVTSTPGQAIGAFDPGTGTYETKNFVEDPIFLTLKTNDQLNIAHSFDSQQITLALTDDKSRIGDPQGKQLAQDIERKFIKESFIKTGLHVIAEGNTALGTKIGVQDLLNTQALLDSLSCPTEDRSTLIPAFSMAQLSRENLNLFTPVANEKVLVSGYVKNIAGSDIYSYNLNPVYSVPAVSVAATLELKSNMVDPVFDSEGVLSAASASFVITAGAAIGVLKAGTILEFADRYRVNYGTRESIGVKYSLALAKDVNITGAGDFTITVDNAALIYGPDDAGYRQTIDVLPLAGDVLTVVGAAVTAKTYDQVFMFTKEAITRAIVPLKISKAGADGERFDYEGFSVRVMDQYVNGTDIEVKRFDIFGASILQRDIFIARILVPKA